MTTREVRFEKLNMSDDGQFRQMVVGTVYETMVDFSVRKTGDNVYEFTNIFATTRPVGAYPFGIGLVAKKHLSITACTPSPQDAIQAMLITVHNKNIKDIKRRKKSL